MLVQAHASDMQPLGTALTLYKHRLFIRFIITDASCRIIRACTARGRRRGYKSRRVIANGGESRIGEGIPVVRIVLFLHGIHGGLGPALVMGIEEDLRISLVWIGS